MLATVSQSSATYAGRSSSNQSVLNSTAFVDATGLSVSIGANETWIFTWTATCTFSATGGLKVAVTTPASATQGIWASITPQAIVPTTGFTSVSGQAIVLSPATATTGAIYVNATVVNSSTAGSVALRFAQNALDGAVATIMLANASVFARKIQ